MADNVFLENSRYAGAPLRETTTAGGRRAVYVRPRITPPPEAYQLGPPHLVTDSDRLDLIAWRATGDATAWWMTVDANRSTHPAEVLAEPNTEIALPIPGPRRPGA